MVGATRRKGKEVVRFVGRRGPGTMMSRDKDLTRRRTITLRDQVEQGPGYQ